MSGINELGAGLIQYTDSIENKSYLYKNYSWLYCMRRDEINAVT